MEKKELTKQDILDLLEQQAIAFNKQVEISKQVAEERAKEFYLMLATAEEARIRETEERKRETEERKRQAEELKQRAEERDKEFYLSLAASKKEFDNRFRMFDSNWGRFVESLVRPGLIDVFKKEGIVLHDIYSNVIVYKNDQKYYEIDLFALNDTHAVVVEIKTTLTVEYVNYHISRMQRIQEAPPNLNLRGKTILGAIAGITIKEDADVYAQKKGLYVLTQKGNLLGLMPPIVPYKWNIE